ncbi:hypothetical protein [Methylomicrobium lacus]|uniref:hypothetical protein n=1 Tax=Methylomicrobium lacus TaxID=136992 RepID=UPI001268E0F2|nr:hypothetical protein [Methylomicrobium lacus]
MTPAAAKKSSVLIKKTASCRQFFSSKRCRQCAPLALMLDPEHEEDVAANRPSIDQPYVIQSGNNRLSLSISSNAG